MKALPSIIELFGSTDTVTSARSGENFCPFVSRVCSKIIGDKPSGVCVVSNGASDEGVIVCPNRLYGGHYEVLKDAAYEIWPGERFIVGGTESDIISNIKSAKTPSIAAWGQHSGKEVQISTTTKMSFDWIIRRFDESHNPTGFVAVEVQSMDTTGNYQGALSSLGSGIIEKSNHGINWANVHKRLIPQLIRKGTLVSNVTSCRGFYFVVPENVFLKFEDVLGTIKTCDIPGQGVLSVRSYVTEQNLGTKAVRSVNYSLSDIAAAYSRIDEVACRKLSSLVSAGL